MAEESNTTNHPPPQKIIITITGAWNDETTITRVAAASTWNVATTSTGTAASTWNVATMNTRAAAAASTLVAMEESITTMSATPEGLNTNREETDGNTTTEDTTGTEDTIGATRNAIAEGMPSAGGNGVGIEVVK